jgi:hypothetical protein
MNFYFELVGDVVELRARLEDGELLGDTHTEVEEGEEFYGIGYDELREAGSGIVVVEDEKGRIVEEDEEAS